jgi:hypothetical protein
MTIEDKHANLVIESNMEEGILLLVQLESIVVPIAITLIFVAAIEHFEVDVRVEEIEVTIMEK